MVLELILSVNDEQLSKHSLLLKLTKVEVHSATQNCVVFEDISSLYMLQDVMHVSGLVATKAAHSFVQ